jgi:hypothetical protein
MLPRCPYAQSFHTIIQESIRLPEEICPEVLARALEHLRRVRDQLQASMSPIHYPSISGRHYCLKDAYEEGVLRVQNLAAFPVPKPAPAPKPQRRSLADLLKQFHDPTG